MITFVISKLPHVLIPPLLIPGNFIECANFIRDEIQKRCGSIEEFFQPHSETKPGLSDDLFETIEKLEEMSAGSVSDHHIICERQLSDPIEETHEACKTEPMTDLMYLHVSHLKNTNCAKTLSIFFDRSEFRNEIAWTKVFEEKRDLNENGNSAVVLFVKAEYALKAEEIARKRTFCGEKISAVLCGEDRSPQNSLVLC